MSKVESVSDEVIQQTVAHLNRALNEIHCPRVLKDGVIAKYWDDFTDIIFYG